MTELKLFNIKFRKNTSDETEVNKVNPVKTNN